MVFYTPYTNLGNSSFRDLGENWREKHLSHLHIELDNYMKVT